MIYSFAHHEKCMERERNFKIKLIEQKLLMHMYNPDKRKRASMQEIDKCNEERCNMVIC